ncbi:MAG: protein-disulfide reductase DsbD domain-containing protein, partial [Limisphaerales bacterium]
MKHILIFLAAGFCFAAPNARAAHTQVKLILSADTAKPGATIYAGVDLKMEPGWHTYWKNSGDAGMPTKIQWQLPPGISAGEIQWPLPEKFPPAEVTTYGYENEVMLLVPLKIETNFPPGKIDLKANVSWLECNPEICIPAKTNLEAVLNIGGETKNSADAATIESWERKVPKSSFPFLIFASWEQPPTNDVRSLVISVRADTYLATLAGPQYDFYPDAADSFEIQAITERLPYFELRKMVRKFSGDWPKEISGVLVVESGKLQSGYDVKLIVKSPTIEKLDRPNDKSEPGKMPAPFWQMLFFAFIGGLILNIMPCVLPVIALKILGFVSEARSEPRRVRNLGLIYALGVLISFLVLAGIVIGVKAAGHRAGWGMQFGSPVFIVCLTTLVLLVALNLFGVYEIAPGGKIMNAACQLASRHGAPGAFFNGVLATILATPCTAPFLASALGFAFSQNTGTIILIFLFVGIGLAAPYVLLSFN